jgi:hypothetical protein
LGTGTSFLLDPLPNRLTSNRVGERAMLVSRPTVSNQLGCNFEPSVSAAVQLREFAHSAQHSVGGVQSVREEGNIEGSVIDDDRSAVYRSTYLRHQLT